MLDPYKLSLINVILLTVLIFVSISIRNFNYKNAIFLTLASFLPLISLLRKGVHESGDFAININKSMDLYNSLSYGIFPVHWASLLNANYGYPLFLFTYPLPYYSIVFFKFMGFSFIASEKIVIVAVFIFSGIGMYILLKKIVKPLPSLLGAILYLYAPYHLVDMHFRTALGELFAYAVLPFVFYSLIRLRNKLNLSNFLLLILSYSALILSHQAIALVSLPFVIVTPFIIIRQIKILIFSGIAIGLTFLLTAFYWLPVINSIQYTHQSIYSKGISFENPMLYLFSPWRMGFLYQGPIGQLSFPMGFVQLGLLITSIVFLLRNEAKKHKKILTILLAIFIVLFFLLLPVSEIFWHTIPFMTNFQFAYRLMLPISFVLALIGGIIATHFKSNLLLYFLIYLAMGSTILNWGTRATIPDITDETLFAKTPYSTFEGEGLQPAAPIWRDGKNLWMKTPPDMPLEFTSGSGTITVLERSPIKHTYIVKSDQLSNLVENTFYFPGWNLYVNGKRKDFTYVDNKKSNLIRFKLEPGVHKIELIYEGTKITRIANSLSLLAVFIIVPILFYLRQRSK